MTDTIIKIQTAFAIKPKFGEPCNGCGWCYLTEVCVVGRELTGNTIAPCSLLIEMGGKHLCKIALTGQLHKELGIGTGCCAKTQKEIIEEMSNEK